MAEEDADRGEEGEAADAGTGPYTIEGAAVRRALVEGNAALRSLLVRRLGSAQEADDVQQLFIVRALERAAQLRDVRSVRGWLSRILATTIVDHQRRTARRRKREVDTDPVDFDAFAVDPDVEVDQAVCDCLYKILPTLKPEYAQLIWRIDLLGEPRDRVAATLGTTVNAINVRLHRGRQALKSRLEAMCTMCPEHGFLDCRCEEPARRRASVGLSTRRTPAEHGPDAASEHGPPRSGEG